MAAENFHNLRNLSDGSLAIGHRPFSDFTVSYHLVEDLLEHEDRCSGPLCFGEDVSHPEMIRMFIDSEKQQHVRIEVQLVTVEGIS